MAEAVKRWLEVSGVSTLYVEPGSPCENAYGEMFIGRFEDELPKREVFTGLPEAKVLVEEYRNHYIWLRRGRTSASLTESCRIRMMFRMAIQNGSRIS